MQCIKTLVRHARILNFQDILLLDDPISALDAQVGQHVFKKAIKGALSGKTVVLVTHQLHLLPEVDRVIVLDQGLVVEDGKFTDLMSENGHLSSLMKSYRAHDAKNEDESKPVKKYPSQEAIVADPSKTGTTGIIAEEERIVGAVQWNIYKSYIDAAGGAKYILPVVFAALVNQLSRLATDLWLSWWTENKYNLSEFDNLRIYAGLGGSEIIFARMFVNWLRILTRQYCSTLASFMVLIVQVNFITKLP